MKERPRHAGCMRWARSRCSSRCSCSARRLEQAQRHCRAPPPRSGAATATTPRTRWLEAEGIRSISLRDRFDSLAKRDGPAAVAAICSSSRCRPRMASTPGNSFRSTAGCARATRCWCLRRCRTSRTGRSRIGGVAVRRPESAHRPRVRDRRSARRAAPQARQRLLRADAERGADAEDERPSLSPRAPSSSRSATVLVPNRPHAYFNGVQQVVALSDYPAGVDGESALRGLRAGAGARARDRRGRAVDAAARRRAASS